MSKDKNKNTEVGEMKNYLNYYNMVWMFTRLIEDCIAVDHIINDVALGDFLGAEGLRS